MVQVAELSPPPPSQSIPPRGPVRPASSEQLALFPKDPHLAMTTGWNRCPRLSRGLLPYRRICYLAQKAQTSPLGFYIFSGSFILFHLIELLFHHILFYYIWPWAQGGHLSSNKPGDPHMSPAFTGDSRWSYSSCELFMDDGWAGVGCQRDLHSPSLLSFFPYLLRSLSPFPFLLLSWISLFLPPSFPCPVFFGLPAPSKLASFEFPQPHVMPLHSGSFPSFQGLWTSKVGQSSSQKWVSDS